MTETELLRTDNAATGTSEPANAGQQQQTLLPELPSDAMIIMPVRGVVLFPGAVLPITIGRQRSIAAAQQAVREQRQLGIVMQRDAALADPSPIDLHRIGTVANVVRYVATPDGSQHLVCQGEQRFQVLEFLNGWPFFVARVQQLVEPAGQTPELEARFINLRNQAAEALQLLPQVPQELIAAVEAIKSPGGLADFVAAYIDIKPDEKQEILETIDIAARVEKVSRLLAQHIEVLRLSAEIGKQTRLLSMSVSARCCCASRWLRSRSSSAKARREGCRARRARPGDRQGWHAEGGRGARPQGTTPVAADAEAAGEYGMVRTYLDWLIELPWSLPEAASIDIVAARRILDEDHYGLDKIKRRIVEYLAVRKLAPQGKAPILCFVGPPGVGKTSLGQSIARAMNRKFVRVSLGGVHDEAEIRGHRRTYIGALPGNIIQSIRKAGRATAS